MARIIIVSNRLPVTIDRKEGQLIYYPSAGGLATGLNSLDKSIEKLWIGWPGKAVEDGYERDTISLQFQQDDMYPVFLSQQDVELFYEGFSNKTIWPHYHYFTQFTSYEETYWESYVDVNRRFAKAVEQNLQEGDMVWVHDYQLMLVPGMLREKYPSLSIGFFLHIPFPSYEIFRTLPWRNEILTGILGADQVGFHTFGYMRHFLSAVYRILGHEHNFGKVVLPNRSVSIDTFPMGIDYTKYAHPKLEGEISEEVQFIKDYGQRRRLILSIDRLDYSKGIPERIYSYGRFLKNNPQYQGTVTLILVVVPSRSNVEEYKELKVEVDKRVGHVNGELGTFNWIPIRYYYRSFPFDSLSAMYKASHIALITPLRDGMNLVAKEFIASKEDSKEGVLILSEMAGASEELQEAILVNPNDTKDVEKALVQAMEMPLEEQKSRLEEMQKKLKRYEVKHWANSFIQQQMEIKKFQEERKTKLLSQEDRERIFDSYKQAKNRLLLLDYDGTLVGFKNDPNAASPDEELYGIIARLVGRDGTKSVIISGRDRHTLGEWFGDQNIEMVSEHGVWLWTNGNWQLNAAVVDNWKSDVRPVLDNLVERTPGSFIEEKDFTLAW
ncbi:MAG: bifunctional alpha,alpha-trehalose-phosphate synthase (UDP-forming)/trehalose-phosphatase, partial [Bacteroidota bacterium]